MDSSARVGVVTGSLGNNRSLDRVDHRGVDSGGGVDNGGVDASVEDNRVVVDNAGVVDDRGDGLDLNLGGSVDDALHGCGVMNHRDSTVGVGVRVVGRVEKGRVRFGISISCGSRSSGEKADEKESLHIGPVAETVPM